MSDNNIISGYENQSFPQGLWFIRERDNTNKIYLLSNIKYNFTFKNIKKFCEKHSISIDKAQLYRAPEFVKRSLTNFDSSVVDTSNTSLWIKFENDDKTTSINGYFPTNSTNLDCIDINEYIKNKIENKNDIDNDINIYEEVTREGDDFICIKIYGDEKTINNVDNTIFFESDVGKSDTLVLVKINITSRNYEPKRLFVYNKTLTNNYKLIYLEGEDFPVESTDDPINQTPGNEWNLCEYNSSNDSLNLKNLLDIDNNTDNIKVYKQYTEYKLNKNFTIKNN